MSLFHEVVTKLFSADFDSQQHKAGHFCLYFSEISDNEQLLNCLLIVCCMSVVIQKWPLKHVSSDVI